MNEPLSNYAHEGKHDILEAIWVLAHKKDNIDPDKDIFISVKLLLFSYPSI